MSYSVRMLADVDRFLIDFRRHRSPETVATYAYHLRRLADWLDRARLYAADLTADLFERYLDDQPWSANTRHSAAAACKTFVRWRYGSSHAVLQFVAPAADPGPQRTLDLDQVVDLLCSFDTSRAKGRRDLAIVTLALETGIRAGEICRLDLDRLDLKGSQFWVQTKGSKGGRKWARKAFTHYTRSILVSWLAARSSVAQAGERTVFVSVGGGRPGTSMTRDGLRAVFRQFAGRAGIDQLSPHDLRRTFATLYLRLGASTRLVQVAGGWDDIHMVERYSRALEPEDIEPYSPVVAAMKR